MGTNYYLFTKDKDFVKKHFIGKSKWDPEYEIVDEPDLGYWVHLCKTSWGWRTLWQSHNNAYKSVKELSRFLYDNRDKFKIYDEYMKEHSLEKFDTDIIQRDTYLLTHGEREKNVWGRYKMFNISHWGIVRAEEDDDTDDCIYTPFDHLEYFAFERMHGQREYINDFIHYWNDEDGNNFSDGDFS